MGRQTVALSILILAASGAGCGERSEPLGELPQPYPVSVRGADDQPTRLEHRPRRIVALDPGSAELLLRLGAGERLVGVPAGTAGAPGVEAVARPTGQVEVAVVEALEPELIVASADADRVDLSRASRESGAQLYVQPAASIEDVERAALDLGFLIGEAVAARRVVGSIRRTVERVEAQLAGLPRRRVFVDTGFFLTVTDRSLLGSLVERAGGENVAAAQAGFGPFDLAELARLDPDVYLATSDSGVTLQELRRNPRTRGLRAIRAGRFEVVPIRLLRPGPRIGDGFAAVAAALHPDAFR